MNVAFNIVSYHWVVPIPTHRAFKVTVSIKPALDSVKSEKMTTRYSAFTKKCPKLFTNECIGVLTRPSLFSKKKECSWKNRILCRSFYVGSQNCCMTSGSIDKLKKKSKCQHASECYKMLYYKIVNNASAKRCAGTIVCHCVLLKRNVLRFA